MQNDASISCGTGCCAIACICEEVSILTGVPVDAAEGETLM